ncbi:MAG: YhcH/YjgK/YiaL family protein [Phycisphaerae bacterium]
MIFGDIRNLEEEKGLYPESIVNALEYIKKIDFAKTPTGRIEIDGDNLYASVGQSNTVEKYDFVFVGEIHKQYVDIHYCLDGSEAIVFSRISGKEVVAADRLKEEDALLFSKISDEMKIILTPGRFAVFFPHDIHLAGFNAGCSFVKKCVVKIHTKLLTQP